MKLIHDFDFGGNFNGNEWSDGVGECVLDVTLFHGQYISVAVGGDDDDDDDDNDVDGAVEVAVLWWIVGDNGDVISVLLVDALVVP